MMRALAPWRPFRELATLHEEIDDLFARFFGDEERWLTWPERAGFVPPVETYIRGEDLVVRVDLPGIDPKDVDLALEGDRLIIRGERRESTERKDADYLCREVRYGRFERAVTLPSGVDTDSVKASYHDGVLEVTMKAPKDMVAKKVPITIH